MPLIATIDTATGDVRIINNNSSSAAGSTKPAAAACETKPGFSSKMSGKHSVMPQERFAKLFPHIKTRLSLPEEMCRFNDQQREIFACIQANHADITPCSKLLKLVGMHLTRNHCDNHLAVLSAFMTLPQAISDADFANSAMHEVTKVCSTMLHRGEEQAIFDMVTVFGADLDFVRHGQCLLHHVPHTFRSGRITRLLLALGANPNGGTDTNTPLLTCLAQAGSKRVASLLLIAGADVYAKNDNGKTAFWCATKLKNIEMVDLMISKDLMTKEDAALVNAVQEKLIAMECHAPAHLQHEFDAAYHSGAFDDIDAQYNDLWTIVQTIFAIHIRTDRWRIAGHVSKKEKVKIVLCTLPNVARFWRRAVVVSFNNPDDIKYITPAFNDQDHAMEAARKWCEESDLYEL